MARRQGEVVVRILGDATDLGRAVGVAHTALGSFGAKVAATAAAAAAAFLSIGTAAAVGLTKLGSQFDEAYDAIRVGTGATGAALDALKEDFRDVARTVPASFNDVGTAITNLNTRTGATGETLRGLARNVLELSRLTETDLNANIAAATRMFGDWGIATDQQAESLNRMFRASQATGIDISNLMELMTQFGSPLRQLGFDFDTTAAMFSAFEQKGVVIETVLPGLKMALKNFAKAGKEPKQALDEVFDSIRNAASGAEANSVAFATFGARAGPDLAAAIREGKFDLDALTESIVNGKETISDAAKDTEDFAEKWTRIRNRVFLALEKPATKMFDAISAGMDRLEQALPAVERGFERFADWVQEHWPPVRDVLASVLDKITKQALPAIERGFGRFVDWVQKHWPPVRDVLVSTFDAIRDVGPRVLNAIRPVLDKIIEFVRQNPGPVIAGIAAAFGVLAGASIVAHIAALATAISSAAAAVAAFFSPVVIAAVAIGALVAGVIYAYNHFEGFREVVDAVARWLTGTAWPAIQRFAQYIGQQFENLAGWFRRNWDSMKEAVNHVVNAIRAALDVIRTYIEAWIAVVSAIWRAVHDEIVTILIEAWNFIKSTVKNAIDAVRGIIETVMALINGDWGAAWEGIKTVFGAVWQQIWNMVSFAMSAIHAVLEAGLSLLRSAWDHTLGRLLSAVISKIGEIVGWFAGLPLKAMNAIAALHGWVFERGREFMDRIWDGLKVMFGSVLGWFRDLPNRAWDAVMSAAGRLFDLGKEIIQRIINGIKSAPSAIKDAITGLIPSPGSVIGGIGGAIGRLNPFADGGVVPGTLGRPVPILAHAGETVFNPAQMRELGKVIASGGGGSGGGVSIGTINLGRNDSVNDLARSIEWVRYSGIHN